MHKLLGRRFGEACCSIASVALAGRRRNGLDVKMWRIASSLADREDGWKKTEHQASSSRDTRPWPLCVGSECLYARLAMNNGAFTTTSGTKLHRWRSVGR